MPHKYKEDRRVYEREYWKEHRIGSAKKKYDWRNSLAVKSRTREEKEEVLTYYGGGRCACIECGFSDIRALSIDHIYNNGSEHRKVSNMGGHVFYNWLKRNSYPFGYQTLCMNCQFIKQDIHKRRTI
jgi:hypothetical protein